MASKLQAAARELSAAVDRLKFAAPIAYVTNPLDYAWAAHAAYLKKYGTGQKPVIFMGMNPGPFGMAQTGVPFGEVTAVRDWLGIFALVSAPARHHPKRPVQGFDCPRSEVSGKRLWGLFQDRFKTPAAFFEHHFVLNYCPLLFTDAGGKNLTPDKFPAAEREALYAVCDEHLRQVAAILRPAWVVGVGAFAKERAETALAGQKIQFGQVLHPSPASPAANRGWAAAATRQ
ncbi:MAG TPA: uracil-DNA glycosylase family protein, partial [Verrucomicrobiae bacterium]